MNLPISVGDLQFGERFVMVKSLDILRLLMDTMDMYTKYCNMDFLFYKTVNTSQLLCYVVSYDIACQWCQNLRDRMFALDHEFFLFDGRRHMFQSFIFLHTLPLVKRNTASTSLPVLAGLMEKPRSVLGVRSILL